MPQQSEHTYVQVRSGCTVPGALGMHDAANHIPPPLCSCTFGALRYCLPKAVCCNATCMGVQVSGAQRPVLRIYTAAGRQLGLAAWEQETIAAMAWTLHEELMVLDTAGEVTFPF